MKENNHEKENEPQHPAEEKVNNPRSKNDQDNNLNRDEIQDRVGFNSIKNADNEGKEN